MQREVTLADQKRSLAMFGSFRRLRLYCLSQRRNFIGVFLLAVDSDTTLMSLIRVFVARNNAPKSSSETTML
jgi:hypothetical protein